MGVGPPRSLLLPQGQHHRWKNLHLSAYQKPSSASSEPSGGTDRRLLGCVEQRMRCLSGACDATLSYHNYIQVQIPDRSEFTLAILTFLSMALKLRSSLLCLSLIRMYSRTSGMLSAGWLRSFRFSASNFKRFWRGVG